jgi:hypothetical protein
MIDALSQRNLNGPYFQIWSCDPLCPISVAKTFYDTRINYCIHLLHLQGWNFYLTGSNGETSKMDDLFQSFN